MARLRAAASVSAMIFTTLFLASASLAGPVDHVSSLGLRGLTDSSLILQVKSEQKCKWKRVCDYFAPDTSCSHPPCCKKSHHEKVCEDTTSDKALHRPAQTAWSARRQTACARPAKACASTYPIDPLKWSDYELSDCEWSVIKPMLPAQ